MSQVINKALCLGYRQLSSGKKGVMFVVLDADGKQTNEKLLYSATGVKSKYAGMIYDLTMEDTTLIGLPVLGEPWPNEEERMAICLESRSWAASIELDAKRKKEGANMDHVMHCLRPLREAYHNTNAGGRAALIAQVITFMQRSL